jgi:MFS family permease
VRDSQWWHSGSTFRRTLLIRLLLTFESILYSTVLPLLPHYERQYSASTFQIGVLTAAYPAGMVSGSFLGAFLVPRVGVRRTAVLGLVLFGLAIAGFGFGSSLAVLDALRFAQGIGCGLIWSGALAWAIGLSGDDQRGEVVGSVLGTAIIGTLIGPVVGTVAATADDRVVFSILGGLALILVPVTLRQPQPAHASVGDGLSPRGLARAPGVPFGTWIFLLDAATIGAASTLLPLRLSSLGAPSVLIGATFIAASVVSMLLSPRVGRWADRRGPRPAYLAGLGLPALLLVAVPLSRSDVVLAVVAVLILGGPLTASTIVALSTATESVQKAGMTLAVATVIFNVTWGAGEAVSAPLSGELARLGGDTLPLALLAAMRVATFVLYRQQSRRADRLARAGLAPEENSHSRG